MFNKILIANRGEIAVRIASTCRAMRIASVAVFSSADADALHVQCADEAYEIGPPPALDSYLNQKALLRAAHESGADAVHPGYGFLAENPQFAQQVLEAGLVWIGPPPAAIALMGDKVAAKRLAREIGVPTVPGYEGEDQSIAAMTAEAERIGYPLMIKAAAGGGGKGMRAVESLMTLEEALAGAQREAMAAFGDPRVFLEKLLVRPRHVEIQILADHHDAVVSLGERDCSLQRRHQKVLEESPSPAVTQAIRESMGEAAVQLARASGYVNAGTVEFLLADGQFYFLEMNTRIQVEHPVTEMVTGRDLVRDQIRLAAGAPLGLKQPDVALQGHAIEVRLYAEDPSNRFLPSTGVVTEFEPPEGIGVRNDVGVYPGVEVTPYYDPMLAKLIVHAPDRNSAVDRLVEALQRYRVSGPVTNLRFLRWIAQQSQLQRGTVDTGFIDREWSSDLLDTVVPVDALCAAAAWDIVFGTALHLIGPLETGDVFNPWRTIGSWRQRGLSRTITYAAEGRCWAVTARNAGGRRWEIEVADERRVVEVRRGSPGTALLTDGERVLSVTASTEGDRMTVAWQGRIYKLQRVSPLTVSQTRGLLDRADSGLSAPMPGTVVKVAVGTGDHVSMGQALVVLEAMKMEHVVQAPRAGIVDDILVNVGDMVPAGAAVVHLRND